MKSHPLTFFARTVKHNRQRLDDRAIRASVLRFYLHQAYNLRQNLRERARTLDKELTDLLAVQVRTDRIAILDAELKGLYREVERRLESECKPLSRDKDRAPSYMLELQSQALRGHARALDKEMRNLLEAESRTLAPDSGKYQPSPAS